MRKLVDAWAEKNKVDVQLDFLTAIGNKINITMAAEAQARPDTTSSPSTCGPCTSTPTSSTRSMT